MLLGSRLSAYRPRLSMVGLWLLVAMAAAGPSDAAGGQGLDARLEALIFREPARVPEVLANGKPTLLVFTDHHCAACLSMVPILERLTERYRGRANILTLDPQDPNLSVRVLSAKYGVWATPMLVVLDATGAVQKKRYGPQREKTLLADLDGLLHRAR